MTWEDGDRQRIVFAFLLTVVALPLLWVAKQNSPAESATAVPSTTLASRPVPSLAPGDATFLGEESDTPTTAPAPIQIDVAAQPSPALQAGRASYKRWTFIEPEDKPCATPLAPFGTKVVVTNTDNGVKVQCWNVDDKPLANPDVIIVIDTDTFVELADLAESPVPVELSW